MDCLWQSISCVLFSEVLMYWPIEQQNFFLTISFCNSKVMSSIHFYINRRILGYFFMSIFKMENSGHSNTVTATPQILYCESNRSIVR